VNGHIPASSSPFVLRPANFPIYWPIRMALKSFSHFDLSAPPPSQVNNSSVCVPLLLLQLVKSALLLLLSLWILSNQLREQQQLNLKLATWLKFSLSPSTAPR